MQFLDLNGLSFGDWSVVCRAGNNTHGHPQWLCACKCGTHNIVSGHALAYGKTSSCGCGSPDSPVSRRMAGAWRAMWDRCTNPGNKSYKDYGGRGIKVCDRWKSFQNFRMDMGDRPSLEHELDRIDNDGAYTPENCRWATKAVQARNKRNNRMITANGETLHMAEWARRLNCNPSAILSRIKSGMAEEDAVTLPVPERPNSKLTADDAREIRALYPSLSAAKLAARFGVSKKSVLNVLHGVTFADV